MKIQYIFFSYYMHISKLCIDDVNNFTMGNFIEISVSIEIIIDDLQYILIILINIIIYIIFHFCIIIKYICNNQ